MDLKFDEMTVDTSLAQEYLNENKDLSELYENSRNSTSAYTFDSRVAKASDCHTSQLQALASSLKQNAALITQLEYHIRNIPIEDTNAQLNLIIQYLNCYAEAAGYSFDGKETLYRQCCFSDEPLLNLQPVVYLLMYSVDCKVILNNVSKATIFISHLFVKLCREAGFDNILLKSLDGAKQLESETLTKPEWIPTSKEIKGLDSGTVAIVSEDADIDSAVDKFLSVSKQTPWRLRRILVQESVYKQFKDALSWKCNLKKQEETSLDSNVLFSDTLTYNGKLFLIDPVDVPTDQQSVVTVEAYRTRKEMISLIQTDKARYLSLWANDIAEINEVTHNTKSPVVWVNNIGDFRGPPQVSAAVFSYLFEFERVIRKCDKISKLCELLQSWQKLDYEARREILWKALDKYKTADPTNKIISKSAIFTCTKKSFVDVGKDYVCLGIWEPVGIKVITNFIDNPLSDNIFESILNGNGFALIPSIIGMSFVSKFDMFEQAGIPLVFVGIYTQGDFVVKHCSVPDRVRVVWTNTGTIFAN